MSTPCNETDMGLFYTAATTTTIGNRKIAPIWDYLWLNGRKNKDIALLISEVARRKNWKFKDALQNKAWVKKI
jgi:hypothetical protein